MTKKSAERMTGSHSPEPNCMSKKLERGGGTFWNSSPTFVTRSYAVPTRAASPVRPIPTELRPKARGCQASEATLGPLFRDPVSANGVAPSPFLKTGDARPSSQTSNQVRSAPLAQQPPACSHVFTRFHLLSTIYLEKFHWQRRGVTFVQAWTVRPQPPSAPNLVGRFR
jgi:hypothetical protein